MKKNSLEDVTLDYLKGHPLFDGISDQNLIRLLFHSRHVRFSKGQTLVEEGTDGGVFYLIIQGSAEVLKQVPTTEGFTAERIAIINRGETFGEMQIIDRRPRSATVVALEPTTTIAFTTSDLETMSHSNGEIYQRMILNIAREISRKLRQVDARFAIALFASCSR